MSPNILVDKSLKEITRLKVWEGNKQKSLEEIFHISGESGFDLKNMKIFLSGDFSKVRMIGFKMSGGSIIIEGQAGMHLGEMMKGGIITVKGNADSWLGSMMEGGTIEVFGSAGDYVGSPYRGSPNGMNGGEIIVNKDAGNGVGSYMRGGIIRIQGNAKEFIGIHMKNGLILVRGNCEGRSGAGMIKGRIVICGSLPSILPTFTIDSIKPNIKIGNELVEGPFLQFTGDLAENGKGKLCVSRSSNKHLVSHEEFL